MSKLALLDQIQITSFFLEILGISLAITEIFFTPIADKIESFIDRLGEESAKNFSYLRISVLRVSQFQRLILLWILIVYLENKIEESVGLDSGQTIRMKEFFIDNTFLLSSMLLASFILIVILTYSNKRRDKLFDFILVKAFWIGLVIFFLVLVLFEFINMDEISLALILLTTSVFFIILILLPVIGLFSFLLKVIIEYLNGITKNHALTAIGLFIALIGFMGELFQVIMIFN
jgi:hypothetical protein